MEFVRIKAGSFRMGSPDSDKDADPDEKPQHKVTLTKDFYLGKYPVTQEQYEKVLGKNPSEFSAKGNMRHRVVGLDTTRFPVDSVQWDDASAFCKVMEGLTHCKCALPSEAQWEYACRAGSETRYFFGSDENRLGDYAWHPPETSDCPGRTYEVGTKKPNAWGLFDMVGNVEQWCRDKYDERYYAEGDKTDPEGPNNGPRVLRGGSWLFDARSSRCAYRDCGGIRGWNNAIGFRVLVRVD
jgi:eukaryotic-like serine/threonine-protein kinase